MHWKTSATPPSPQQGIADLWKISLSQSEEEIAILYRYLNRQEKERAQQFAFEKDQKSYVITRGSLRKLLALYLHIPPQEVLFQYSEKGKPALAATHQSAITFNMSDSYGLAVIALSLHSELGVDIEKIQPRPKAFEIVKRFFTSAEFEEFQSLPQQEQLPAFYAGWTRKEAYLKAKGQGLWLPLDSFSVTLTPHLPPKLLYDAKDPHAPHHWQMKNLNIDKEYAGALVSKLNLTEIRYWDFTF